MHILLPETSTTLLESAQVVDTNSHTQEMTNSADLLQKQTYLDLHCLQRQGISWFRRTRVKEKVSSNEIL